MQFKKQRTYKATELRTEEQAGNESQEIEVSTKENVQCFQVTEMDRSMLAKHEVGKELQPLLNRLLTAGKCHLLVGFQSIHSLSQFSLHNSE